MATKQMNKQQIEHLSRRIDSEIAAAVKVFAATLPKAEYLDRAERIKEVLAGKAEIDTTGLGGYGHIDHFFTSPTDKKVKAQREKNDAAVAKFAAPLHTKKSQIMDSAILGGADEALAALNDFIKMLSKKK